MRLVVGLGNPTAEYKLTRHNLGFMVLDELAARLKQKISTFEADALTLQTEFAGESLILAKPQTYMNLSGRAVVRLLTKYRLAIKDLIVIYDELDLPLGKIRIRERGSSGGHNGVQSIIDAIGTEEFTRIRLGINENGKVTDGVRYVLSTFKPSDREAVEQVIDRTIRALETILSESTMKAMSLFN